MTTGEIAKLVGGEVVGDSALEIESGQALHRASKTQLAFWEPRSGERELPGTRAGCVIVNAHAEASGPVLIRVGEPRKAFARALRAMLGPSPTGSGVHASAHVHPTAQIGPGVSIGPAAVVEAGAVIGAGSSLDGHAFVGAGAVLGSECRLGPGATVYGNARLGDRAILHAGAVVGADGFGLVFETDHYEKFPQVGGVDIGDDVEIGANSCVDRGALDDTRIGSGTKLDNLVHIGHNCQIGRNVVMAAQVGLSGGVVVEDYAVLGGQAGVGDRARIGARVQLGGQAGLLPDKQLASGESYWGTPARPLREELARQARVNRLPKQIDEIKRLEARVADLEAS